MLYMRCMGLEFLKGLVLLENDGGKSEFLHIKYKGKDKLYVPVDQVVYVKKYIGAENPSVNGLHDKSWKRITDKVKKSIELVAKEIYLLNKKRQFLSGFSFKEDTVNQLELESAFPHQLTDDQKKCIDEIKLNMESNLPMERLLCGDVGFGKTEVFLRSIFKAFESKKQVAVLVPTTLLAQQHYVTFLKRFKPFNLKLEVLSRYVSK